jgi:hypothetical protein
VIDDSGQGDLAAGMVRGDGPAAHAVGPSFYHAARTCRLTAGEQMRKIGGVNGRMGVSVDVRTSQVYRWRAGCEDGCGAQGC